MTIAIYFKVDTRAITKVLQAPDLGTFPDPDAGELAVLSEVIPSLPGWIDEQGAAHSMPERPTFHHQINWQTKEWEDARSLDDLKAEKWESLKAERSKAEGGTFVWNGHTIDADMARLNGAATSVMIAQAAGQSYSDVWTLADNSTMPVTGSDILSMGLALAAHVSACHARGRLLRQQIENATTREEVDAVTWMP